MMQVRHPRQVHIVGVPLDLGAGRRGVDMGPSALRIAGLGDRLAALGHEVVDRGNVAAPGREIRQDGAANARYLREIARTCRRVYQTVRRSLETGAVPVVLGGDHSLAAGSVAASAAEPTARGGRLGLIWVDAHADMNTPDTTPSGNVHGMPLAALLGPEPAALASIGGLAPAIRPEHTVLVGIRDLDTAERTRVLDSGITVFTMKEIDRRGLASVATDAVARAAEGTEGLHVSFDLDACDPTIAPGVGTPVQGGLSYREAHTLMEVVADHGSLRSLDLVEANPILDSANRTAELGVELVLSALGKTIL